MKMWDGLAKYCCANFRVRKKKKDDEDERLISIFKQIHINIPFLEAMIHMPKGAKVLKDLLSHKEKLIKVASSIKLTKECSTIIQRSLAPKEGDLGSFTLPSWAVIDVHEGKLSLRVKDETVTFNIGKSMKSKHSHKDYLYYADHTMKLFREQQVDTINHDGEWTEEEDKGYSNKVQAVYFYHRTKPVEPLEWKALENRLKPSSIEPPILELKELAEHLVYAFLQEHNKLPMVISSALSTTEKARLFKVLKNHKRAIAWIMADVKGIDSSFCTHKILMVDEFKPSVQPQREVIPNKEGMDIVKNEKDELNP
nr:hypothetical protein [Tanacetum cinerariifolium]